ncbi:A24 family peptidase [Acetobacter fallax]|uniref:Prepilin type IV endopeptidase peptidase domain-containing protein n=1 Tax=Acetobacter fallax TaxID=1737473 RepID=A0ABX0KB18_9PROT|nr:A24 family peptidase [Acetobacter fallax]NHO33622.1 hypothetical protein [Acetobacter fallax]NHO37209.1 hypothetical protein [Acetobacter fallax]
MLQNIIFFAVSAVLLVSAFTDLRARIIYNSAPAIVIALSFLSACNRGEFILSIQVVLVFSPFLYLLWVFRILGGGDVKLLISLLPLVSIPHLFSLFFSIALTGTVLAAGYLIRFFLLSGVWRVRRDAEYHGKNSQTVISPQLPGLPYAVAIAFGTILNINNLIG